MKKVLSIIALAAMANVFVACGPSKEEIAADKKRIEDSIKEVENEKQDAIALAEAEKAIAEEKQRQDSIEKAKTDSIEVAAKKGKRK